VGYMIERMSCFFAKKEYECFLEFLMNLLNLYVWYVHEKLIRIGYITVLNSLCNSTQPTAVPC
jgi:hypothetical protein